MNRAERRREEAQNRKGIEAANRRLKALMSKSYADYDHDAKMEMDREGVTERMSCSKGCAHCCNQFVPATMSEAAFIAMKHPKLVQEVRGELLRQEVMLHERGIKDINLLDHDQRERFAFEWFGTRTPCAFLDKSTQLCRIYAERPAACRTHVVLDTPQEMCRGGEDGQSKLEYVGYMPEASIRMTAAHIEACIDRYGNPLMGPLQTMVLAVLDPKLARVRRVDLIEPDHV